MLKASNTNLPKLIIMKLRTKNLSLLAIATGMILALPNTTFAGNEDRAGSAGATELLINPFARSAGWADAATASATGLDALYLNIAGTAFTEKTDIMFTRTNWLVGSDVNINAVGLSQRVGEAGVISLSLMSMDFGDVQITTTELPEGGIGDFSPTYSNITLGYAREFSNSIYGGLAVKIISESITNAKSSGVAFDAGIRYVTGERDQIKFGIALRNVGPPLSFVGDGFSVSGTFQGRDEEFSIEQREALFELPSQVNIGASYDFMLAEMHKLTIAGNFTSNSFTKDQINVGAEYLFDANKARFLLRAGMVYEEGVFSDDNRTTALTGPTAGISIEMPAGSKGTLLSIDYSYRTTNPFRGIHSIGARINLGALGGDEEAIEE